MTGLSSVLIILLVSLALASFVITSIIIRLSPHVGLLDHPMERKIHSFAIPNLGGLSISLTTIIGLVFLAKYDPIHMPIPLYPLIFSGGIIVALGIVDDIINLNPFIKLLFQILAVSIFLLFSVMPQICGLLPSLLKTVPIPILFLFFLLWILTIINAVNMLDGIDGLAGSLIFFALLFLSLFLFLKGEFTVLLMTLLLTVVWPGFLIFNLPPARIFMGDTGSMFVGFYVAVIPFYIIQKTLFSPSWLLVILLLSIPIFDLFLTIIRRLREKHDVFKADRGHLHHRLLFLLKKSSNVLFLYWLFMFLILALATAFLFLSGNVLLLPCLTGYILLFMALKILEAVEKKRLHQ